MAVKAVEKIAAAIESGFKLIAQVLAGSDTRRMRKAIEYGEKIIRRYEEITEDTEIDKEIDSYIDKFFKYNN